MQDLVDQITRLTHSHQHAINGAILESFAVDLALRSSGELDVNAFVEELKKRMKPVEERSLQLKQEAEQQESENRYSSVKTVI